MGICVSTAAGEFQSFCRVCYDPILVEFIAVLILLMMKFLLN